MNPVDYQTFTDDLVKRLSAQPLVIGLVAMGSMAAVSRQSDEWSDHDFWVVAERDAAAGLRDDRTWLPRSDDLVVWFAETVHGRSAIYSDGHLVEYAVFEPDELDGAPVNEYRVLIDRGGIEERMTAAALRTAATATKSPDDLFGTFLSQTTIGVTRFARGELLSANHLIRGWAATTLAALVATVVAAEMRGRLDNLDPNRRFEAAYPAIGRGIGEAVDLSLLDVAAALVDLAERELGSLVGAATPASFRAVRVTIARARRAVGQV